MKNLVNYNVQELDIKETTNIQGGSWFWPAAAATFLYNCVADWKDNLKAFKRGSAAADTMFE
jgi:hypothetical protein